MSKNIYSSLRDRSFITSQRREGGGYNFIQRLDSFFFLGGGVNFENAQNVRGVEILRHRTRLLCKSCQSIL